MYCINQDRSYGNGFWVEDLKKKTLNLINKYL